eukprot:c19589_g1_i1.p1 GENE.c19589_g1_i1~~c19589_g1_i1.p1  ORF type:complete len:306 (-),score=91.45 c19589_g1_i1:155-1072(-)
MRSYSDESFTESPYKGVRAKKGSPTTEPLVSKNAKLAPYMKGLYRQMFHEINISGNGFISSYELGSFLLGLPFKQIKQMVSTQNNQLGLDLDGFIQIMTNPETNLSGGLVSSSVDPQLLEEYKAIYAHIAGGNKSVMEKGVTAEQISSVLSLPLQVCKEMVSDGDRSGKNLLSFSEFVEVMINPKTDLETSTYDNNNNNTNTSNNAAPVASTTTPTSTSSVAPISPSTNSPSTAPVSTTPASAAPASTTPVSTTSVTNTNTVQKKRLIQQDASSDLPDLSSVNVPAKRVNRPPSQKPQIKLKHIP